MLILDQIRSNFIVGVDIIRPGLYAYAVLINNLVVEQGEASDVELIKILKKYRPIALAVDNLRELLDLGGRFLKYLSKLPFTINVIQVTRVRPDLEVPVESLVREYLGENVTKLNPQDTAVYLAKLVYRGVGCLVKLYEPETKIVIKARIGTRDGGMSCRRFERNVYLRIRQLVNEISSKLKKAGLDFDLFFNDSEGARAATFIVYADKSVVRKVVKPSKSMDVIVSVEQVLSRNIKFISLTGETYTPSTTNNRYVILGIDPGVVTGVAVLDLNGRVLLLHSGRNLSRGRVLDLVYEVGTPIIVATDVSTPPDYVKKLCAMTQAVLYTPERDMSVAEKAEIATKLAREQGIQVRDPHQRDALAAAYRAFIEYKPKFDKVVEEVKKLSIPLPIDEVKMLVVKGYSIKQAIDIVLNRLRKVSNTKIIVIREKDEHMSEKVKELESTVKVLESELRRVENEKKRLEEELQRLQDEMYIKIKRDIEVRELIIKVQNLEKRLLELEMQKNNLQSELEDLKKMILELVIDKKYVAAIHVDLLKKLDINSEVAFDSRVRNCEYYSDIVYKLSRKIIIVGEDISDKQIRNMWNRISVLIIPLTRFSYFKCVDGKVLLVSRDELEKLYSEYLDRVKKTITINDLMRIVNEYRQYRWT